MRRLLVITLFLMATVLPAAAPAAQSDAGVQNRLIELAQKRPSVAGPLNGDLPTGPGADHLQVARVELRDFYAAAIFSNPDSKAESPWDVGISFRRNGTDDLTLMINSSGTWSLMQGVETTIASGAIESLATGRGEINAIDLVAIDGQGYFALNGQYVATLDLTAGLSSGDIAVGAA